MYYTYKNLQILVNIHNLQIQGDQRSQKINTKKTKWGTLLYLYMTISVWRLCILCMRGISILLFSRGVSKMWEHRECRREEGMISLTCGI